MSKCGVFFMRMPGCLGICCLLVVAQCLLTGPLAQAQTGAVVRIDTLSEVQLGQQVEIPIYLDAAMPGQELNGFDWLIQYDPGALMLLEAEEGQLLVDCQWEYFTYRAGDTAGLLRVVALADVNNGPVHPLCNLAEPGELASLTFLASSNPSLLCSYAPFYFYWQDCGDNAFAVAPDGDTLLVSDRVFDPIGFEITSNDSFPTYGGTPSYCLDSGIVRGVDYYAGGIQFTCEDTVGDYAAVITTDKYNGASLGDTVTLGVHIQEVVSPYELAAFDLLFDYDPTALSLLSAIPGDIPDSCGWEYFEYREGPLGNCGGEPCPDGTIRLVAVADLAGPPYPGCLGEFPGSLAYLTFQVADDSGLLGQVLPVRHIWYDCGDNTFSLPTGDTLLISREVYDYDGFPITSDSAFPTIFGAPDTCADSGGGAIVMRGVDYYTGGIKVTHGDDVDYRGDINLNGVAYEVADYFLFASYFWYGISVFDIDQDLQIAATDINMDGLVLTLEDLLYLYSVMIGELPPPVDSAVWVVDTVLIKQNLANQTVEIGPTDSLAAMQLFFIGEIVPTLLIGDTTGFTWWFFQDSDFTSIMIYPIGDDGVDQPALHTGLLLSYSGEGFLGNVEAADYSGTIYHEIIEIEDGGERQATVRMGKVSASLGSVAEVPITLQDPIPGFETGGFDVLLTYDPAALVPTSVLPGDILEECEWEYFNYRFGPGGNCGGEPCPDGTMRIVAVADLNDGPHHPVCYASSPGTLARASFLVTTDLNYECQFVPIDWIWYDCGDNAFSSRIGDSLLISHDVFDAEGNVITHDTAFPTKYGAPSECLVSGTITRAMDFRTGGVDILCDSVPTMRGDVNLNGIAYEIADYIVFTNYFFYGLAVFTVNVEAQIAATDVNADGIVLTLSDLVYLLRVIMGDAPPLTPPRTTTDTVVLVQDTVAQTLTMVFEDSVSALYMVFDGAIEPDIELPQHDVSWVSDSAGTRLLIMPAFGLETLPYFGEGLLGSYSGTGQLIQAAAATDGLSPVVAVIEVGGADCCIARGNVDHDPEGVVNIVDLTFLVGYLFDGGEEPSCLPEADLDGDEVINIVDLTLFVEHLFGSGEPLPPCP